MSAGNELNHRQGNMGGKIGQNENSLFYGGNYATCVANCPDFTCFRKWEFQIKFLPVFFCLHRRH